MTICGDSFQDAITKKWFTTLQFLAVISLAHTTSQSDQVPGSIGSLAKIMWAERLRVLLTP
jgi:hypothetical protein